MGSIRRRLFLLAAAALVPLVAMAGFGVFILVRKQHEEAARAGIELTRALAIAVAAKLGRSTAVLEAVATSPAFDAGDLDELHRRMARVVVTQSHWHGIVVVDGTGTPLIDTRVPYGTPPPPLEDREGFARLRESGAPVIGNLVENPDERTGGHHFSVQVPVVREGAVRYAIIALVDPVAIFDILRSQGVPSDWVISIFDAAGKRVARSRAHAQHVGTPGAPSLVAMMASPADEAWGRTTALEGDEIYTAYSRLATTRWSVATGVPVALVDTTVRRSLAIFGGGVLLSVLIGGVVASWLARGIATPIAALGRAAQALGRRDPIAVPMTTIAEIQQVADALTSAADERARGEHERDALLARTQEARNAAEAANRAKDEFLAMLGHELRNPLAAVTNAVALLDHAAVSPEAAVRARQIIARQTAQLARLTDDLLDAGRVITGKIVLHREPLDVAEIVTRVLATVDVGRHRVTRELASVWVDGDPARIEQVVSNLVGNALKYTRDDGSITVRVTTAPGEAVLVVRDDGIGMPAELAARAFELFVQGDRPLDRSAGGLGIGLTLVQRLAQLHGGMASAFSAGPGQGTEICVRLPSIPAPVASASGGVAGPEAAPRGRDVLLVEDNADARAALCELLEIGGHRVRSAADGPSGLAAALAAPPEIALIDVGLPGIDGYELARRIRAAENGGPRPLLIALTGYGAPEDRQRALDAGFDRHLVKPVDWATLSTILAG
jgi:signal transduction histidine kinase/CheY-like chemotaxis protein